MDVKADSGGRYLFLRGTVGGVEVILASIYAPYTYQDPFINKTLESLLVFSRGQPILGGNFTSPLFPSEDTSSGCSSILPGPRKQIRLNESLLQDEEVLKDVTRELDCYIQTNDTLGSDIGKYTRR